MPGLNDFYSLLQAIFKEGGPAGVFGAIAGAGVAILLVGNGLVGDRPHPILALGLLAVGMVLGGALLAGVWEDVKKRRNGS